MKKESSDTLDSVNEDTITMGHSYTVRAHTCLRGVVGRPWFETLIAIVILANCVTMGFEVELLLGRAQFYKPAKKVLDNFFAVVFLVELFMRIAVVGWRSYIPGCGVQKSISVWNLLEAIVVVMSCITAWLPGLGEGALELVTVLRALRLMRVARIVSRVRLFHEVWLLLRGLAGSMRVLFWTVVVIFIITYMFAVFGVVLISVDVETAYNEMVFEREQAMKNFTGYTDCSAAAGDALDWTEKHTKFDEVAILYHSTRGIWQWIFTLLQVLTLDSWMSLARPMQDIVEFSWVFFYLYIALVVFVLMNLVTAIIVDNALRRSREDEKEVRQQKKKEQKKAEKRCKRLFESIDEDGDECLTVEELKNACEDPWLSRQLQVLDITSDNAEEVFKMMDTGDGILTLDEFFEGTQRMQGAAEGRDMVRVLAITQRLARAVKANVMEAQGMSSASLSPATPRRAALRQPPAVDLLSKLDLVCNAASQLEGRMDALDRNRVALRDSPV